MMKEQLDRASAAWFLSSKISAEQIALSHGTYMRESLTNIGEKGQQHLRSIIHGRNTQSEETDGTQDGLIEKMNGMSLETLSQHVGSEVASLRSAKSALDYDQTTGKHRIYAKSDRFMVEFNKFLGAYSGIVNILASADAQYGGIATATLALLFTAATMKSRDEVAIVSAMGHISDRLPDFGIYQRIYPDPELGQMLSDAYRDVILLVREATRYFQRSTFRRHIQSMRKPAEFQTLEQNMRDNFSRVRLECETLLGQRVDDLTEELENMQKHRDIHLVSRFRTALNVADYDYDAARESLAAYREYLERFEKDRHRQNVGLSDFFVEEASECWKSERSIVFVLYGSNDTGIASVSESWLSTVAVEMTQDLLKRQQIVAFEMCDQRSTCEGVLARLIYQLLDANPHVVRKAENQKYLEKHISGRDGDSLNALRAVLLKVIDVLKKPVFVVLDRPEINEDEDTNTYITTMLNIAKATTGTLKVLIVLRAELWDVPRQLDTGFLRILRLDQRRIG